MKALFIEYPKCTTCQRAKKWLIENNVVFEDRNIISDTPNKEELRKWIETSNKPINKFFNTSGMLYRSQGLSKKLPTLTDDEKIDILASDGMLIKRPILVIDDTILLGFKEDEWKSKLKEH